MRRGFDLDVSARPEGNFFAPGQFEDQFLDEGSDVAIRADRALPLADAEDLGGDLDLEIVFDLHLAGQAHALAGFAPADVARFGREHAPPALEHGHLADPAAALTAAGRGNEDLLGRQGAQQRVARLDRQGLVRIVVDRDFDFAAADQLRLGNHQQNDQRNDHAGEHQHAQNNHLHRLASSFSRSRDRPSSRLRVEFPKTT